MKTIRINEYINYVDLYSEFILDEWGVINKLSSIINIESLLQMEKYNFWDGN